jgi:ElaB/YqjD/DUF883 family membrane-anchored ribosome-binding protein
VRARAEVQSLRASRLEQRLEQLTEQHQRGLEKLTDHHQRELEKLHEQNKRKVERLSRRLARSKEKTKKKYRSLARQLQGMRTSRSWRG